MAGDDDPPSREAVHLATVQAWRAQFPGADGSLDAVVLALGAEGADLPPIVVPIDAVAGLVGVLLRAAGIDLDVAPAVVVGGPAWAPLLAAGRTRGDVLDRSSVPSGPGVYAWFRDGVPVHLARAVGKRGLRAAIGGDALQGDADPARRAFRSAVAGHLGLGGHRDGEARLDLVEVEVLDTWIRACEVAWLPCATPASAADLESVLRAEHEPSPSTGG